MIIEEMSYDGQQQINHYENYDYHFKHKGTDKRGKKGIVKRLSPQHKGPARLLPKHNAKKAILNPQKNLIKNNFGLFNKNRKKEEEARAAQARENDSPDTTDAQTSNDNAVDATPMDEANQGPGLNIPQPANNPDPDQEPQSPDENQESDGSESSSTEDGPESSFDEPAASPTSLAKSETKTPDKSADTKKKSGPGAWIGWTCLGLATLLVGYALYNTDKKSNEILAAIKAEA